MIKRRLLALPLSLALALAGASGAMAQEDSEEAPDMSEVPEYTTEAGQWVYAWMHNWMAATGMAADEIAEEFAGFDVWFNGLSEADADDIAEAHVASAGIDALQTEINDGDFLDLDDDEGSDEDESE